MTTLTPHEGRPLGYFFLAGSFDMTLVKYKSLQMNMEPQKAQFVEETPFWPHPIHVFLCRGVTIHPELGRCVRRDQPIYGCHPRGLSTRTSLPGLPWRRRWQYRASATDGCIGVCSGQALPDKSTYSRRGAPTGVSHGFWGTHVNLQEGS